MPGKKVGVKFFEQEHPECAEKLKDIKTKHGMQRYLSLRLIFAFTEGPVECAICQKQMFNMRDRPSKGDIALCSHKCVAAHARACCESYNLEHHGVANFFATEEFAKKRVAYLQSKYGKSVTAPLKVPGAKDKFTETCLERYGVDHVLKSKKVRAAQHKTHAERYGSHYLATTENRKALEESSKAKWGVTHPSKSEHIKDKKRASMLSRTPAEKAASNKMREETCIKRFGARHPSQNETVLARIHKSRFRTKSAKFRRSTVHCMGSEPVVVQDLSNNTHVAKLTTDKKRIGSVSYEYGGKERVYFPDMLIESELGEKIVIEVKSTYTLGATKPDMLRLNEAKFKAAQKHYARLGIRFVLALVLKNRIAYIRAPERNLEAKLNKALEGSHRNQLMFRR